MAILDWDQLAADDLILSVYCDTETFIAFRMAMDVPYQINLLPPVR